MANADSIKTYLTTKGLPPTDEWLASFLPSVKATTPAQATHQTALWRVLRTDLTTCIKASPTNTFPPNTNDGSIQELRLPGPITAQILDIEDIGRSRWSQVEALEAAERGETTRGRQVIRVIPEEGNDDAVETSHTRTGAGPHKLLLQDAKGTKVYAIELVSVGVGTSTSIGMKMVLRNVVVARGVVLLEPDCVESLGGKVEIWDVKWREERKKVLKEKAGWREPAA